MSDSTRFDVWRTDEAQSAYHRLRPDIQKKVNRIESDLARRGCEAADYRLQGKVLDNVCAIHVRGISGSWRVLVYFPNKGEVTVFFIGRHDEKRAHDVYRDLADRLGLPRAAGVRGRKRPDCCTGEGLPPPADALLERLDLLAERYG